MSDLGLHCLRMFHKKMLGLYDLTCDTSSILICPAVPGHVLQSVTCLAADTCLTADPGVGNSIPARCHTFAEIDNEIIFTAFLFSSADSRRVFVSYKRKYVQEVLVNCSVKLFQEKSVVR